MEPVPTVRLFMFENAAQNALHGTASTLVTDGAMGADARFGFLPAYC